MKENVLYLDICQIKKIKFNNIINLHQIIDKHNSKDNIKKDVHCYIKDISNKHVKPFMNLYKFKI